MYLSYKENYEQKIQIVKKKLKRSIKKIDYLFDNSNFEKLIQQLDEYDKKVEEHSKEFIKVNEIWEKLKLMFL